MSNGRNRYDSHRWPEARAGQLSLLPLLVVLVQACGYSPHKIGLDGGDVRDVGGETESDSSVDALRPSPGSEAGTDGGGAHQDTGGDTPLGYDGIADATADTDRDAPTSGIDTGGAILDGAAGTDGQAGIDAPTVPDAPAERDAPVAGSSGGGSGGTGGVGGIAGAPDANSDTPITTDAAGGLSTGGVGASSGGTGGGGATGSGGLGGASGGTTTGGSTDSGGSSSATGGASTGGSTPTGGTSGSSTASGGATTGGTGGDATGGATSTGGTSQAALWSGCNMLLHMDETTWNGTAGEVSDASAAGNPGTAFGGPLTTDSPAKAGRAGLFFGSGHVSVPDAATLHAGNAFSVSAWVYPTALNGTSGPGIVSKRNGYQDGAEFSVFIWTGNHVYVDVGEEEPDRFASVTVLANNTWYHVAVVFDGSADASERVRLYINGQLDTVHTESSPTVTPTNAPISIGNLPNGGSLFIGVIDEVAFWQRPLTAAEVQSLYQ